MAVVSYKGRSLTPGQKVKVYRNLNNGKLSVMDFSSGLVVAHADSILLYEVEFKINKAAQRNCRIQEVRNVHAFAVGIFVCAEESINSGWNEFTYNPFKHSTFVDRVTGLSVKRASKVHLSKGKYFYLL